MEAVLDKLLERNCGRGMVIGRKKGSNDPFAAWHRDLGNCLHLILGEAVACCEAQFAGKKDELETLDTITKMLLLIYTDARGDRKKGLVQFRHLYEYIDNRGDSGKEVYNTFSTYIVQTIFCYLFTCQEMAIGLPQTLDVEVFDFTATLNILSVLDDDTRVTVLEQLKGRGHWPTNVDYSMLLQRMDDYLEVIRKDQERLYAEMENKCETGDK
jgi:hypothetical protein